MLSNIFKNNNKLRSERQFRTLTRTVCIPVYKRLRDTSIERQRAAINPRTSGNYKENRQQVNSHFAELCKKISSWLKKINCSYLHVLYIKYIMYMSLRVKMYNSERRLQHNGIIDYSYCTFQDFTADHKNESQVLWHIFIYVHLCFFMSVL